MSLLAGAYSRFRDRPLPSGLEHALVRSVSRRREARRNVWASPGAVLVHCETGAYTSPAFVRDDNSVTAIAGDPLLVDTTPTSTSRAEDTRRLHDAFRRDELAAFAGTTGHFAAVHYDAAGHRLTLTVDRTGFRPLYYWVGEHMVVFASALHILRALDVVPRRLNVRAVLQHAAFGFIPGDATPYVDVRLAGAADVARFDGCRVKVDRYWQWDRIRTSHASAEDLADETMTRIGRAIDRRLGADRTSVACLTGGMDTRLVICELLRRDVQVHTLNVSLPGGQDQMYARLFAAAAGTRHHEMAGLITTPGGYPDRMAQQFLASRERSLAPPERPHLLWSGIGGDVGIGGVGLDADLVSRMRTDHPRAAVEWLMAEEGWRLPGRVVTRATHREFAGVIGEDVVAEFARYDVDDSARRPWLFSVLNESRRSYAALVENVDEHQCESLVPLCDGDVLAVLASVPVEYLLDHTFYMRLVARTDRRFLAAPWQTYPGHAPCPTAGVPGMPTQWDLATQRFPIGHLLGWRLRQTVSREFPSRLMRRSRVLLAIALETLRLRDTRHALVFAEALQYVTRTCDGIAPVQTVPDPAMNVGALQSALE